MPVSGVRWSPDGYVLSFTTGEPGESPRLWDLVTNGPLTTWNTRLAGASAVAFSPDRLIVAAGYPDGTATLWNSNTGQAIQTLDVTGVVNAEGIVGLEFSPDGARLATFSGPGEPWVVLWDAQTGDALGTYTPVGLIAGPVAYPVMSPDWHYLAWVSRGTVILVDPDTGLEVERFNHEDFVVGVSFTPDSRLLATSSAKTLNGVFSPVVSLWNAENGALILDQPGFESPPLVAFSPDGTLLATAWGTLLETWIIGP